MPGAESGRESQLCSQLPHRKLRAWRRRRRADGSHIKGGAPQQPSYNNHIPSTILYPQHLSTSRHQPVTRKGEPLNDLANVRGSHAAIIEEDTCMQHSRLIMERNGAKQSLQTVRTGLSCPGCQAHAWGKTSIARHVSNPTDACNTSQLPSAPNYPTSSTLRSSCEPDGGHQEPGEQGAFLARHYVPRGAPRRSASSK